MAYSPILVGERPSAPTTGGWSHNPVNGETARKWGLIPANSDLIDYTLTWHHNIPWADLRDSWNVIFTFCTPEVVGSVFDLFAKGNGTLFWKDADRLKNKLLGLKEALGISEKSVSGASYYWWMERVKDVNSAVMQSLDASAALDANDADSLGVIVAWQKWNIVEGPKESVRLDDPGSDDFDDFREVRPDLYTRFNMVYTFYEALKRVKNSFVIVNKDNPSTNTFVWAQNEKVKAWDDEIKRNVASASSLVNENIVPMTKDFWKVVPISQKLPNINTKTVYWVVKNEAGNEVYDRTSAGYTGVVGRS